MGIAPRHIPTRRLEVALREAGEPGGQPVLFIHGNCSDSRFWDEQLQRLPAGVYGVAADLRGYGETEPLPIDATRGLRDFSDDLWAALDALGVLATGQKVLLVGHSVGGGVAMQMAMDRPQDVAALLLESPVSPFGFGGTRDASGTPITDDFAGSGGGTANPDFVARLQAKDRSEDAPTSPRNVLNTGYFKPPFRASWEEALLDSVLSTRVGEGHYPGDMTASPHWPGVAPGTRGMNNALSPRYLNLSGFAAISPKPPVLWVRGDADAIVSDTSFFDFGYLGQLGLVPGWPGVEACPPQPMVSQTRGVLDAYRAGGGAVEEVVLSNCGHSPHIEAASDFAALLKRLLS